MTPAKMFNGDLYVLVSDAVQMAENAYKNGQADERELVLMICDAEAIDPYESDHWTGCAQYLANNIRARS